VPQSRDAEVSVDERVTVEHRDPARRRQIRRRGWGRDRWPLSRSSLSLGRPGTRGQKDDEGKDFHPIQAPNAANSLKSPYPMPSLP